MFRRHEHDVPDVRRIVGEAALDDWAILRAQLGEHFGHVIEEPVALNGCGAAKQ
jgi:hypothetical protein